MNYSQISECARRALRRAGARAALLDDLVQEVLIIAWQKQDLHSITPGWVSKVASFRFKTVTRAEGRRSRREREYYLGSSPSDDHEEPLPVSSTPSTEILRLLIGPAASWSGKITDGSIAGLARTLGIPKGTIYRRLHELRRRYPEYFNTRARIRR